VYAAAAAGSRSHQPRPANGGYAVGDADGLIKVKQTAGVAWQ